METSQCWHKVLVTKCYLAKLASQLTVDLGTLNCIRALGGYTIATSAETAFDTETFKEAEYLAKKDANHQIRVSMNWYNALMVVGLFCLGFVDEAASLGFYVYETRDSNPK